MKPNNKKSQTKEVKTTSNCKDKNADLQLENNCCQQNSETNSCCEKSETKEESSEKKSCC